MRLWIIIVLAAAVLLLSAIIFFLRRKQKQPLRSKYIDALHALIEGRRDDALHLLMQAVRGGENYIDAYIRLGNLLREKSQIEKAFQIHKSLTVRRDLSSDEEKSIQLAIAEDLAAMGKIDKGISVVEGLKKRGRDADVLLTLHRLFHKKHDYDSAYNVMKDLSRVDSTITPARRASYLTSVASLLISYGRQEDAVRLLGRARKEDKKAATALYLMAGLAMEKGELSEAAEMWEKLLNIDIEYFDEVIPKLEKSLFELGRFQDLENILEKLAERFPDEPALSAALADLYAKKGEIEKGIDLLETDLAAQKREPSIKISLASLYLKSGRYDEALSLLEETDGEDRDACVRICDICGYETEIKIGYCPVCNSFDSFLKSDG
jgi:lipopolysaccharide biosynthesis regulator YciM